MELYDKLNADPRIDNCHPRFILWDGKKHTLVATADGENVYLTPEGRELFKEDEKPARGARRKQADLIADPGDLDLGE